MNREKWAARRSTTMEAERQRRLAEAERQRREAERQAEVERKRREAERRRHEREMRRIAALLPKKVELRWRRSSTGEWYKTAVAVPDWSRIDEVKP